MNPIRRRRRLVCTMGALMFSVSTLLALGFGSGCIFDQGSYQGGGRRSTTATAPEETEEPTPTATEPTSTNTSTPDSGGNPPPLDSGLPDVQ